MQDGSFEGPEKKVELVVDEDRRSLRELGDARWEQVVRAAGAAILSKKSTDEFDAYLLSESSLFVYDQNVTLITCGRTRIADAVEMMLEIIPPIDVVFLALERKNEHFPREQPTSFEEDARRISERLPGQALRFGDEHSHCIQLFHTDRPFEPDPADTTLEVLMHGIGERADAFRGEKEDLIARARATGVGEILPGFEIDDHQFSPTGYSLNALKDDIYYTLHVTPEDIGSYVSFETNFDFRADPTGLVLRVVDLFRPDSFDVFTFQPDRENTPLELPGYALCKHVFDEVCGYGVTFRHFVRPPGDGPEKPKTVKIG